MTSHGSATASKPSGVCSPAVAVPHQSFYPNSGVNSPARFEVANYGPVARGLPLKQVGSIGLLCVVLLFCVCRIIIYKTSVSLSVPHRSAALLYITWNRGVFISVSIGDKNFKKSTKQYESYG